MNKLLLHTCTLLMLAFASTTIAADKAGHKHDHDHDHDHAKVGPTGGKLITDLEPHLEFFVNKDKKIEIRFVDEENKVIAPGEQVIAAVIGERSNPTKLTFAKEGDKLVSDKPIPEGNLLPTVLQVREKEGAKAHNEKFNLNLNECPECKHPEYACTCDHDHDHDEKKK